MSRAGRPKLRAETALIVEDDEHMRALLASMVRELGFTHIVCASVVAQARQALACNDIGLALVDLCLGAEDGCDLIQFIRNTERDRARLPIVVVSHAATQSRILAALDAGADGFIAKPLSIATFQRQVALARSKSARSKARLTALETAPTEIAAALGPPAVLDVD